MPGVLGAPVRRFIGLFLLCIVAAAARVPTRGGTVPPTVAQVVPESVDAQTLPDSVAIILFSVVLLVGATLIRHQRANSRSHGSHDRATSLGQAEPMVALAQKELS